MSGMNSDQLHRSTLGIYSSLMNDFNPSLQKLVSLGNSYVQAFKTLAATSDAYFSALSKIGEKAFHTVSSRSIGDVLIQISERQQRLTLELEGVFRWFSMEVLEAMNNNIRLDRDYLSSSRETYEMELRNQTAALERLRRRSTQAYPQGGGNVEYVEFLKESYSQALQEEERRYRFLAEKHCGMTQSIAKLMNKNAGTLQQKSAAWTEEVDATRRPEAHRPATLDNSVGMKEEEIRRSRDEAPLGKIPSRAPSPEGSVFRFGADSAGGGGGGGRVMRARVAHQPAGSNPTLLPFTRGQIITVLVKQPRNGWLFGRADNSSRQGWFPASFVEAVDDLPMSPVPRPTHRSNSSMSSHLNQPGGSSQGGAAPPPPPPPPPPPQSPSLNKNANMPPVAASLDKRAMSNSEKKFVPTGHTVKCVWGSLAQNINQPLVGGPTESRRASRDHNQMTPDQNSSQRVPIRSPQLS